MERRRHCNVQAGPELAPAAPPGCRRLPQHMGEAWGWILKDWVGKGDYVPEKGGAMPGELLRAAQVPVCVSKH